MRRGPGRSTQDGLREEHLTWKGFISSYLWSLVMRLLQLLLTVLVPVLQAAVVLLLVLVISVVVNIYLRRVLVPSALIHERLYFDHIASPPTARVKLLSAQRQWAYLQDGLEADQFTQRRFLQAGSRYDISAVVTVAKSARNFAIGTAALRLRLLDSSGEVTARSVRPLVMPFQSPASLLLEALLLYPFRATGTWGTGGGGAEAAELSLLLMDDFSEPVAALPATESLELTLHTQNSSPALGDMDVLTAYVTVMPRLRGLTCWSQPAMCI
ncbi:putative adipose-regulatory protein-domain-containing protein [Ochromonadaceae sp. CCMP2298]|nr:putative adipose-regulatory protein-domain-containing protein [Ochromonadaceae sp. CCMP2298]